LLDQILRLDENEFHLPELRRKTARGKGSPNTFNG